MDSLQPDVTGRKASSIDEFCTDHRISRAMFYKLLAEGKAPRVMKVGSRTLISIEAAAAWRARMETAA